MSLREEQSKFSLDILKLLSVAQTLGYEFTFGEVFRTPEQQEIYLKSGRSKTSNSMHLQRLAFDINFFKDGKYLEEAKDVQKLGDYWESLDEKNRWGGSWRGLVQTGASTFVDVPHFERKV